MGRVTKSKKIRKTASEGRKARPKRKKATDPITGDWDVLPHGIGKVGDLEDKIVDNSSTQTEDIGIDVAPSTVEKKVNSVAEGSMKPKRQQKQRRKRKVVITQDTDYQDEDFEEKPSKVRVTADKKVKISKKAIIKIESSTPRKQKKHPYGLTPGHSPFPDWQMPTPEACEEVYRLLSGLHGEVKPPEVIPPPSMEVTGCGEVPDLLDAILRTLLSASTTSNNSNLALKGLKNKFGLRTEGPGKGSVNWEAVHQADLPTVIDAIKQGGLATVKGTNIKKILDTVYAQNITRREVSKQETSHKNQKQEGLEVKHTDDGLLSMDHVFEMTTEEAMDELTKLPGIGVKTASCVILFCMKRPSFAVDTHVWRHCKWLGWVPENATRDQTFSHCEVRVPDRLKYPLHQLFLRHGKTCGRCRANTSAGTAEWEKTICPIEHLVNRKQERKLITKIVKKSVVSTVKKNVPRVRKLKVKNITTPDYSDEDLEISSSEQDGDSDYEETHV
ncbi:DNA glycosylase [Xylogone sp. PMI_703]|nr:DNA glycosylase [Xylogone sp. PMI_703]